MKKLILLIFICSSSASFSQIITKDIFCSLQFYSSSSPVFRRFELSSTANHLPDSISGKNYLNRINTSDNLVHIIELMSDHGWELVNSTTFPSNTYHEGYVMYVYKKQVSYTEEMLRQGKEAASKEAKKYKYYPD